MKFVNKEMQSIYLSQMSFIYTLDLISPIKEGSQDKASISHTSTCILCF